MRPNGHAAGPPEGWLSVGHLRRPHGLAGDIFLQLTTDRTERADVGVTLFGRGTMLTITASRVGGNGRIVARFDGIADRTAAEQWTNVELFAAPIADDDALWVHELIGMSVIDQDGRDRGPCASVLANPAAPLLELESGALVPSNFITSTDDGVIHVEVPDGLFDLFDD